MTKTKLDPNQMDLKYPIGTFSMPNDFSTDLLDHWIQRIERLPFELGQTLYNVEPSKLDATYRDGSWNVRQLVHHLADSHMHGLTRIKWALTEDQPEIKTYNEVKWTSLPDASDLPINISLKWIDGIHTRWTYLLRTLSKDELSRTFYHPQNKVNVSVYEQCGLYAWHGDHHLAHIRIALKNGGKH